MDVHIFEIPKLQHNETNRTKEQLKHPEYITTFLTVKKLKRSRYRPGVAQRVGRGIALLFHDRGTRRWVSGQQNAPAAL